MHFGTNTAYGNFMWDIQDNFSLRYVCAKFYIDVYVLVINFSTYETVCYICTLFEETKQEKNFPSQFSGYQKLAEESCCSSTYCCEATSKW